MLSAKTSLAASTLASARGSDGLDPELGIGDGWLCILVNSSRIALILVCMRHGLGLRDENLVRLTEALCFAKSAKHWPVLFGDWNFEASELRTFMGLSDTRLSVILPAGAEFTCLQGKGTLTSYLVVAEEIASSFDSCTTVEVPWGTHLGVRFHVRGPRSSPWYWAISAPKPFEAYDVTATPAE